MLEWPNVGVPGKGVFFNTRGGPVLTHVLGMDSYYFGTKWILF